LGILGECRISNVECPMLKVISSNLDIERSTLGVELTALRPRALREKYENEFFDRLRVSIWRNIECCGHWLFAVGHWQRMSLKVTVILKERPKRKTEESSERIYVHLGRFFAPSFACLSADRSVAQNNVRVQLRVFAQARMVKNLAYSMWMQPWDSFACWRTLQLTLRGCKVNFPLSILNLTL